MKLTHENDCEWRLGHDCTCTKIDPRDAEIARLQSEVKRLNTEAIGATHILYSKRKEIADTAWNDAIEAAASALPETVFGEKYSAAIRALKRT